MWRLFTLSVVVAVGIVTACGPSGSAGAQCMDQTGENVVGTIQVSTQGSGCGSLSGTAAAGASCSSAADCAPTCCSCGTLSSNPQSVEVAYCKSSGVCATSDETCCTFIVNQTSLDAGARSCM
jgi:hypothetical protein